MFNVDKAKAVKLTKNVFAYGGCVVALVFSVYWAFDHHWGAQVDRCLLLIGATPLQMCGRSNSGIRLHRHLRETPDEERDHHDCRTSRQSY